MCEEGLVSGREGGRRRDAGWEGGMGKATKGRTVKAACVQQKGADVTSLERPRHPRVMPCFSVNVFFFFFVCFGM